ncbi:hypothetical protein MD588_10815 [Photobacterium sp. SDRW27]|uniref:hypothetical protein n=1 Tax=Photobacterium obscurum TaxID=2829490 RepID=UPI002243D59A|nr:hypothetical protein [Photobacterium obscurum]MCW8329297.1 hypothetical protein [Photobacterium obscurum]
MDSSDFDGIKRDISLTINNIFEDFEEDNNRLPTIEEFRTLFAGHAEQYIGPMDRLSVEGISNNFDRHQSRELKIWRAANELEAEQRFLRSEQ